jgi:hypothetical protein
MVRGSLQVKVEGSMCGSSWSEVDCEFSPATQEFSSTDSKGKQQRVADCWVVDVLNREGKKQHRFDVVSQNSTLVALAAVGGAEKQRWLAAMETKQAKQAREKRREEEQALTAKHGVSTIEEARRATDAGQLRVGFVDVEGQGDQSDAYDSLLVTPLLLLSKVKSISSTVC